MATILVVEDEDTIREIVQFALETKGHRVLAAKDASEALILSSRPDGVFIDVLLTDACLKGMNGSDLANSILRKSTRTKVMLMSGAFPEIVENTNWPFIQKPFELGDLVRRIENICEDD